MEALVATVAREVTPEMVTTTVVERARRVTITASPTLRLPGMSKLLTPLKLASTLRL